MNLFRVKPWTPIVLEQPDGTILLLTPLFYRPTKCEEAYLRQMRTLARIARTNTACGAKARAILRRTCELDYGKAREFRFKPSPLRMSEFLRYFRETKAEEQ